MPAITAIVPISHDRFSIHIDGEFCCTVRRRTFSGMNLAEGSEISCDDLKERERNYWKYAYESLWEQEGHRIERVMGMVARADDRMKTLIEGFGADTTEFIDNPVCEFCTFVQRIGTVESPGHSVSLLNETPERTPWTWTTSS